MKWGKQKATEIVVYIASRAKNPTVLGICKLMYLADKLHLSRYGRYISRDRYVAMKLGPVPSWTYDLMKMDNDAFRVINKKDVQVKREADLMELSESDIMCLDEILAQYGESDLGTLIDVAHDDAWNALTDSGSAFDDPTARQSIHMSQECIAETLQNASEVKEHLLLNT